MQFSVGIFAAIMATFAAASPQFGTPKPHGVSAGGCAAIEASCTAPSTDFIAQARKDCAAQYAATGNTADNPTLPQVQINCQIKKILEAQELPCAAAVLGSIS